MTRSKRLRPAKTHRSFNPVSPVALCTLTAIATWDVNHVVRAEPGRTLDYSATSDVAAATAPSDLAASASVAVVAPPEPIGAQEFSAAASPTTTSQGDVRYYQEYQATAIVPDTTAIAPPEATPVPETIPAIEAPPPPTQTASISDPVWIVPTTPPDQAQPVNFPTPTSTPTAVLQAPPPANAPPRPDSPTLVVTATDVQVTGTNDAALQQTVLQTAQTKPGGATSQVQLQNDVAAILNTGLFASASVSSRSNPAGLSVTFQVDPIVVRSLQLSNAGALTPTVASELLRPQLGAPISPALLDEGVRRINQWYAQNGYPLARVLTVRPSREGIVTIEVAEGVVGEIRIRFADRNGRFTDDQGRPIQGRTRESFIRQEIQLRPGQAFQDEVARQDLQRLSKLGLFERVNIAFEGDARRVNVIYDVIERPSRAVNVGAGYNNDSGIFGTISYRDDNVGGVAQQFSNNLQIGQRTFQFDTRFTNPYRESTPDRLGYSVNAFRRRFVSPVFDEDIRLANGDRVRESKFGGGLSFNKPISDEWSGSLGLNYTRTSIRDRDGTIARFDERGNPLSFSGKGIDDLTTISFAATRDLRDNPVEPTQGSILTLSTEQSIPIGLGNILNNRLQANYAQYVPVNLFNFPDEKAQSNTESFREVLAFNLQGGTVIGDLPPYNAFVLGGSNSVRGYGSGDVGTGRSYFLASTEYRFPIYRFLGGVLFADFATDLGSGDTVLGEPAVERGKPGSGFGIGAGLRVRSPFGIIRADYGFNDQGESRLQFGFGQRF